MAATNDQTGKPDATGGKAPIQSMEYHLQILQSKMEADKNKQYISPSDNIMSPCTAKLNAFRNKQVGLDDMYKCPKLVSSLEGMYTLAYSTAPPDELPFTNYATTFFGVIDHIWYSTNTLEVVELLNRFGIAIGCQAAFRGPFSAEPHQSNEN